MSTEETTVEGHDSGTPKEETPQATTEETPTEGTPVETESVGTEDKDKRINDLTSLYNKAQSETKDALSEKTELEEKVQEMELEGLSESEKLRKENEMLRADKSQMEADKAAKEDERQSKEIRAKLFKKYPNAAELIESQKEINPGMLSVKEEYSTWQDFKEDQDAQLASLEKRFEGKVKEEEQIVDPNNPSQDLNKKSLEDMSVEEMSKVLPHTTGRQV